MSASSSSSASLPGRRRLRRQLELECHSESDDKHSNSDDDNDSGSDSDFDEPTKPSRSRPKSTLGKSKAPAKRATFFSSSRKSAPARSKLKSTGRQTKLNALQPSRRQTIDLVSNNSDCDNDSDSDSSIESIHDADDDFDSVSAVRRWKCMLCTTANMPSASQCSFCTAGRPVATTSSNDRDKLDFAGSVAVTRSQRAAHQHSTQSASQRKHKHQLNLSQPPSSVPAPATDNDDWCTKYRPTTFGNLAVHAKKLAAVSTWLERNAAHSRTNHYRQSLLVLTGPPGCCKSALLDLLADRHTLAVTRFSEVTEMKHSYSGRFSASATDGELLGSRSKLAMFEEFLSRSTRYQSLFADTDNAGVSGTVIGNGCGRLIVIEEFPFISEPSVHRRFLSIINTAIVEAQHTLVLSVTDMTETSGTFALENFLSPALLAHPRVAHIEMNGVNNTLMKKALKRVVDSEGLRVRSCELDGIVERSKGDLRQAIQILQFETTNAVTNTGTKTSKRKSQSRSSGGALSSSSLSSVALSSSRDTSFSLFHSLGKLFYPKPDTSVDAVLSAVSDERNVLLPMLAQNYLTFFAIDHSLDYISSVSDRFSDSDTMLAALYSNNNFTEIQEFESNVLYLTCSSIVSIRLAYRRQHSDSDSGNNRLTAFRAADSLKLSRMVGRKRLHYQLLAAESLTLTNGIFFTELLPYKSMMEGQGQSQFSTGVEVKSMKSIDDEATIVPVASTAVSTSVTSSSSFVDDSDDWWNAFDLDDPIED